MSAERPQREVAYRIFAAEFDDCDFTYAESDEERAPNYVVTPTGGRVNRLFVVGVLTEVEQVSDDVLRARIVDPTGAFVVYAGQYQPEAMAFFDRAEPPMFVAVTGKARTFQPEDSTIVYTSIRPESANEVTAETRDRWVVQTAEQTLDRIETFAGAMELAERGDALTEALTRRGIRPGLAAGIPKAMDHYGTTTGYLAEMRRIALDAARVVANEIDEVEPRNIAPDDERDVELDLEPTLPETEYGRSDGKTDGEPATEPVPDSEAEPEPDSKPETDVDAEPEPEADSEPEPAEDAESEPETDAEPEPAEDLESEPETDAEPEPAEDLEPESETDSETEPEPADDDTEPASEASPESETADSTTEATTDVTDETAEMDEVDSDEMYELSEEEREAVESEYGVGFETGNEIQEPGEADMETPEEREPADESSTTGTAEEGAETESMAEAESAAEQEPDAEADAQSDAESVESAGEDADLEDAVVETMSELDEGDGAPREELVERVASDYDASTADVEEAIQDALMGGRCYESGENRITPI